MSLGHLQEALVQLGMIREESETESRLRRAIANLIAHLEEETQKVTPSVTEPASRLRSSVAIGMPAETKPTWSTSRKWSFRVNPDGSRTPLVQQDILDWLSFQLTRGEWQVEVILSTPTHKASTSPDGLPLPSTEAPSPEANGHVGDGIRRDWRVIDGVTLSAPPYSGFGDYFIPDMTPDDWAALLTKVWRASPSEVRNQQ